MLSHTSIRSSRSWGRPWPDSMRRMIFSSQPLPSRQGVHCPHDSLWKKRTRRQAARTAQVVSSSTITEPEPIIDPPSPLTLLSSREKSSRSGPNQNDDAPPGTKAFSSRTSRTPPPSLGS